MRYLPNSKFVLKLGLILGVFIIVSCQTGHCRKTENQLPPVETPEQMGLKNKGEQVKEEERVFVYKYDGSLQCGQGRKIPLKEMAGQLEGIKIFSMKNKPDGLMHIQVCGSPSGFANVYEVGKSSLPIIKEKGFKLWEFGQ